MKKICKVVALPTKEKTLMAYDDDTKEYFIPVCNFKLADSCSYIYLYIASYDEIKEGDYIITGNILGIYMFDPVNNTYDIECKDGCVFPFKTKEYFKKVIATTDSSLNLPLMPEQFIKDYCDANGIDKVMVDYDIPKTYEKSSGYDGWRCYCGKWHYMDEQSCDCSYNQPIIIDNCISISPIKESWSREELPIQSIMQVLKYCEDNQVYDKLSKYDDFYYKLNEWVKRNV